VTAVAHDLPLSTLDDDLDGLSRVRVVLADRAS
jgi:hypothetical protein